MCQETLPSLTVDSSFSQFVQLNSWLGEGCGLSTQNTTTYDNIFLLDMCFCCCNCCCCMCVCLTLLGVIHRAGGSVGTTDPSGVDKKNNNNKTKHQKRASMMAAYGGSLHAEIKNPTNFCVRMCGGCVCVCVCVCKENISARKLTAGLHHLS